MRSDPPADPTDRDADRFADQLAALWARELNVPSPVAVPEAELNTTRMQHFGRQIAEAVRGSRPARAEVSRERLFTLAARSESAANADHTLPQGRGVYSVSRDEGELVLQLDLSASETGERLLFFRFRSLSADPSAVPMTFAEGVLGLPAGAGTYRVPLDSFLTDEGQTLLGSIPGWSEVFDLAAPDAVTAADEPLLAASNDPQPLFGRPTLAAALARLRHTPTPVSLPKPTRGVDFLAAVCHAVNGLWAAHHRLPTGELPRAAVTAQAWLDDATQTRDQWLTAYRTDDGRPDERFVHLLAAQVGVLRVASGERAEVATDQLKRAWEHEPIHPRVAEARVLAAPWGAEARVAAVEFAALAARGISPVPVQRFELPVVFDRSLQGKVLKLVFEEFTGDGPAVLFPDLAGPGLWVADAAFWDALGSAWRFAASGFAPGARVRWRVANEDGTAFATPSVFEGGSAGGAVGAGLLALSTRLPSEDCDGRVVVIARVSADGRLSAVDEAGLRNKLRATRGVAARAVVVAPDQPAGAWADGSVRTAATIADALEHLLPDPLHPVLSAEQLPPPVDPNLFVGRSAAIEALDRAWRERDITIHQVVAAGGVGKSTVVWKWVREYLPQKHRYRLCPQVFEWSFYSQEDHEYQPNSSRFLNAALQHFARCDPTGRYDSLDDAGDAVKGERVAEAFMKCGGVMVLDGVEPLQMVPSPGQKSGSADDAGLRVFLQHMRRNVRLGPRDRRRLLVLTTRWRIAELDELDRTDSGCVTLELGNLTPADGAHLLRGFHLRSQPADRLRYGDGTPEALLSPFATAELERMARDVGGHALALVLLASLMVRDYGGRVEEYRAVRQDLFAELGHVEPMSQRQATPDEHRYARRVIRLYLHALGRDGSPVAAACRRALFQLGLFDRPARTVKLRLLADGPPIPEVTDLPAGATLADALRHLEDLRLLTVGPNPDGVVNTHPLVREYLSRTLRQEHPDSWRAAHSRLFDRLNPHPKPRTTADLEPWLEKMAHGCLADRHHEVLRDVFVPQVLAGERMAAIPFRGAHGAILSVLSHYFTPERNWTFALGVKSLSDRLLVLKTTGECLSPTRGYSDPSTLACYRQGIELTRPHPELRPMEHLFRAGYCRGLLASGECGEMGRVCREVYEQAVASGDRLSVAAGAHRLALAYLLAGRFREAAELCDRVLADPLSEPESAVAAERFLIDPVTCSLLWKGFADWHLGRPADGLRGVDKAVSRARQLNHPHTIVVALCFAANVYCFHQDVAATRRLSDELLTATREHGFFFWGASGYMLRGWAVARDGQPEEGLALLDRGIEQWQSGGCKAQMSARFAMRAEVLHRLGQRVQATENLLIAEADAEARGEWYWLAEIQRQKVLMGDNPPGSAGFGDEEERTLEDAVEAADRTDGVTLRVRALHSLLEGVRGRRPRDPRRVAAVGRRLADALAALGDAAGCPIIRRARALVGRAE